jgi:uncharacterized membrane protein
MIFATVTSIDNIVEDNANPDGQEITFTAKTFGNGKSETVLGRQILDDSSKNTNPVSVGDKVVLLSFGNALLFQYHYRFDKVVILGLVFVGLVLLMGGKKGFNTIISLALTCLSLFYVFIPSIGAGFNIYFSSAVICIFIVIMTLNTVYGPNKKSVIAVLSCVAGVGFSAFLSNTMDRWMKLTGYINEEMYMLNTLFGIDVDLKAIMFSMITIGALGAIMDVSISIVSALNELKENNKEIGAGALMRSGFSIGRDIMGTMANTLILAYIGSSLIVVLVYATSNYSLLSLLNKEEIIFEFLQSLVGNLSLLFTIPFTTVISSIMFSGKDMNIRHSTKTRYRR